MPVRDLYQDMMRFILGAEAGRSDYLKALPRNHSSKNDSIGPIPPWVRDFSASSVPAPMDELASSTAQFHGNAKIWPSEDPDELILDDKKMDTIQATSGAIPLTSNLETLTKSFSEAMPQWISLAVNLLDSRATPDLATENSILWLARMLLTGMPWSSFSRSELIHHFKAWMAFLSQSPNTSKDKDNSHNPQLPAGPSTAIERALRKCRERCPCATKKGNLCLAPAMAKQGDVVAYFAGGYSFFVLWPCGTYHELVGVCRVVEYDGDAVQTLKDDATSWKKIILR
ncbi:MAG: hypothetical protein M1820_007407 [Bogoriella megaspora]|nr:MAG: hypothetical protein M1820_007407 [Bogoriella megaspora]